MLLFLLTGLTPLTTELVVSSYFTYNVYAVHNYIVDQVDFDSMDDVCGVCGKFHSQLLRPVSMVVPFPLGLNTARRVFLLIAASYVIIVAVIRLLLELFQFINLKFYYFLDWVNWTEVILFLCSIIFVSVYGTKCLCPTRWQWQIGCIAVFLSWISLIIFFRKIPLTGTFVHKHMMSYVIITVVRDRGQWSVFTMVYSRCHQGGWSGTVAAKIHYYELNIVLVMLTLAGTHYVTEI